MNLLALASASEEYLVLQPDEAADPFSVTLEPGTHRVEWFSLNSRETENASKVTVKSGGSTGFTAPFSEAGLAVLYSEESRTLRVNCSQLG
jgi:uncharacterized protein YchJ